MEQKQIPSDKQGGDLEVVVYNSPMFQISYYKILTAYSNCMTNSMYDFENSAMIKSKIIPCILLKCSRWYFWISFWKKIIAVHKIWMPE